jgi:RHS repeat-associated protein
MKADYYAFGMLMPNRFKGIDDTRHLFNGMEHDGEVSGEGNSYTTQFRQYDPRLGRWKSLDPLMSMFPNMSPYVGFANNPIFYTDPYGLAPTNGDGDPPKEEGGGEPKKTGNGIMKEDGSSNGVDQKEEVSITATRTFKQKVRGVIRKADRAFTKAVEKTGYIMKDIENWVGDWFGKGDNSGFIKKGIPFTNQDGTGTPAIGNTEEQEESEDISAIGGSKAFDTKIPFGGGIQNYAEAFKNLVEASEEIKEMRNSSGSKESEPKIGKVEEKDVKYQHFHVNHPESSGDSLRIIIINGDTSVTQHTRNVPRSTYSHWGSKYENKKEINYDSKR